MDRLVYVAMTRRQAHHGAAGRGGAQPGERVHHRVQSRDGGVSRGADHRAGDADALLRGRCDHGRRLSPKARSSRPAVRSTSRSRAAAGSRCKGSMDARRTRAMAGSVELQRRAANAQRAQRAGRRRQHHRPAEQHGRDRRRRHGVGDSDRRQCRTRWLSSAASSSSIRRRPISSAAATGCSVLKDGQHALPPDANVQMTARRARRQQRERSRDAGGNDHACASVRHANEA